MNRVTLGKLVLETAQGTEKERQVPAEDVQELTKTISERVRPKIEDIRAQQRRALEDSRTVVLL